MNARRLFALAAGLAICGLGTGAGWTAPDQSSTKVTKVFECAGSGCDVKVEDGDVATRSIEMTVTASASPFNLEWVELETRVDDGSWICVKHWDINAASVTKTYQWDTRAFPSAPAGCPESPKHGKATPNGTFEFRVGAQDVTGTQGRTAQADYFTVLVNNAPPTPSWWADPLVEGDLDGAPSVRLQWTAEAGSDVVEYHFVRQNPDGSEIEVAFDAAKPGRQGCEVDHSAAYTCYDDFFPTEGYEGSYTYSVYAFRSTAAPVTTPGVSSCVLSAGRCVESQGSTTRTVTLRAPEVESVAPLPRETGRGGSRPSNRGGSTGGSPSRAPAGCGEFCTGEFDPSLPYDQRRGFVVRGADGSALAVGDDVTRVSLDQYADRSGAAALAAGLLLLVGAAHMARVLNRGARA
ncbi:MAG TPA: hypothetical protein VGB83_08145 [Actinomycetota bacterium]